MQALFYIRRSSSKLLRKKMGGAYAASPVLSPLPFACHCFWRWGFDSHTHSFLLNGRGVRRPISLGAGRVPAHSSLRFCLRQQAHTDLPLRDGLSLFHSPCPRVSHALLVYGVCFIFIFLSLFLSVSTLVRTLTLLHR